MTVNAAAAQEFCAGKQARLMTSSRKKRVFSPTFVMQCFPTMQENVALDHYPIILGSSYLFKFAAERWTRLDSNEDKMFMHRSHLLSICRCSLNLSFSATLDTYLLQAEFSLHQGPILVRFFFAKL